MTSPRRSIPRRFLRHRHHLAPSVSPLAASPPNQRLASSTSASPAIAAPLPAPLSRHGLRLRPDPKSSPSAVRRVALTMIAACAADTFSLATCMMHIGSCMTGYAMPRQIGGFRANLEYLPVARAGADVRGDANGSRRQSWARRSVRLSCGSISAIVRSRSGISKSLFLNSISAARLEDSHCDVSQLGSRDRANGRMPAN